LRTVIFTEVRRFIPFGLSLSKPAVIGRLPFDKLRANGGNQRIVRH